MAASRDDSGAQERQRQNSQMTDDPPTWKKVSSSRKSWTIRGRTSLHLGDSCADFQSLAGEAIHVTSSVASQLRAFRAFDVGMYGPRLTGLVGHSLMVVDRLDLLRFAVVAVVSVGLSHGVDDDLPCLARVIALGEEFKAVVTGTSSATMVYCRARERRVFCARWSTYPPLVGERANARFAANGPCCDLSPCCYGF